MSTYLESEKVANSVMTRVYGYMFAGLLVSALMAAVFAYVPDCRDFLYRVDEMGAMQLSVAGWIILLSPLVIVLFFQGLVAELDSGAAFLVFLLFCALMGMSLSCIFLVYTTASILMCFVITAATFGAMAIYGLVTKSDLTSWGSIFIMALFGLIIAMVINIFLGSETMDFVISLIAVVVFCGLTAYDTQKIRDELYDCYDKQEANRIALRGALSLYLDFINLLLQIIKLLGKEK